MKNDKVLVGLIKKKRVKAQITNIRNETQENPTDTTDVKKIIQRYCELFVANKLINLDRTPKKI